MRKVDLHSHPFAELRKAKIVNEFTMVAALRALFEQREELYKPANRVAHLALELLAAINRYAAERNRERVRQGDPLCRQVMWTYGKEAALTILTATSPQLQSIKDEITKLEDDFSAGLITSPGYEQKQQAIVVKAFDPADQAIRKLQERAQKPVAGGGAFNAGQIGEILRLLAGVCESVNPDPADGGRGNLAKNVTLRLTGQRAGDAVDFNFGDYCGLRAAYRNTAWGSKAFSKAARVRTTRSQADINRYGTVIDSVEAEVLKVLNIKPPVTSGNTRFVLGDKDVVGLINRALGLLDGADISGTTSDTIWALESLTTWLKQFDPAFVANPNLLLLPVAAIVGGFHHTVLEVGMALSINYDKAPQRIAYAPGFFTSLQNDDMRAADPSRMIESLLRAAEQHPHNAIVLVADGGAGQQVVYRAEEGERDALRKALELTAASYGVWHALAQNSRVTSADLKRIYPTLID